jgi:LPXTG-motif cell wall-anchored protein
LIMKKLILILGLVAGIWTVGGAPGFAQDARTYPTYPTHPTNGGGAPAPEIGASALGLLLAGGVAFYIIRRRRV